MAFERVCFFSYLHYDLGNCLSSFVLAGEKASEDEQILVIWRHVGSSRFVYFSVL